jgi:uncharacterized protein (TIGR02118 family)
VYKFIAAYRTPADTAAFDAHYQSVHTPLVKKIPGLAQLVVNRGFSPPWGGEAPYYLIAEMHFADEPSFTAAMSSPENKAAGRDLRGFAKDLVTMGTMVEI